MEGLDSLSDCHRAPVMVAGDVTKHWVCSECGQACDVREKLRLEDIPDGCSCEWQILGDDIDNLVLGHVSDTCDVHTRP